MNCPCQGNYQGDNRFQIDVIKKRLQSVWFVEFWPKLFSSAKTIPLMGRAKIIHPGQFR
jgi:hypothetical protein